MGKKGIVAKCSVWGFPSESFSAVTGISDWETKFYVCVENVFRETFFTPG